MQSDSKKKLIYNIAYYTLVALMVVAIVLVIMGKNNKANFIGDNAIIWIMTDSMSDEIEPKTYISIRRAEPHEVKVGDVITFISDDPSLKGSLNTHRVVQITGSGESIEFVTKGDHNAVNDSYTAKGKNLIGIYEKKLNILTAIGRFFATTLGFASIIIAFVIFTAITVTPEIIKAFREKENNKKARADAEIQRRIKEETEKLIDLNESLGNSDKSDKEKPENTEQD